MIDYLFYKIYGANKKGSLNDIAEWAAVVLVSLLFFMNIAVITGFLKKWDVFMFSFNKTKAIILIIMLFIVNYFCLVYKKKHQKIIVKYENESERKRRRGNLFVWLYVIISFFMIFVVAFYKPR